MANDSIGKTVTVAVLLCIVCSVLVSTAAVKLRPLQDENRIISKKKNILKAAGLFEEGKSVDTLFKQIDVKYVDLERGAFDTAISATEYNAEKALKDPTLSVLIPAEKDLGKIKRRPKTVEIYLVRKGQKLETIILPIYGKGLWSTMYAFLALEGDGNTVKGYSFYEHGETPGLGGEVDNPLWQAQWVGKKIYDQNWKLAVDVLKGKVNPNKPEAIHQADGLSGATLTNTGVRNLMHYWLGEEGFAAFLGKIRKEEGLDG